MSINTPTPPQTAPSEVTSRPPQGFNQRKSSPWRYSRRKSAASLSWILKRSEEHTSELQSLMRISSAVFCLKKKTNSRRRDTVLSSVEATHALLPHIRLPQHLQYSHKSTDQPDFQR